MDTPIRVGIVGANPDRGWGSGVHARVIPRLEGFALSGVCTTRAQSAAAAAAKFGAAHAFTDAEALVRHADVDLVAICVLAPHHHAIARAALEAGKHVYCEWPLALTIAEAEELARLAAARGLKAMIGLHLRGAPALRHMAALIAGGAIGRVQSVNLHVRVFGPAMRAMATRANGTTLLSIYGGHLIDAIDHYFGGIVKASATGAIHLPPADETGVAITRDAADHLLVQGRLGGGALFALDLAGVSPATLGARWRIEGEHGSLTLTASPDLPAIEALTLYGPDGKALPVPPEHDCDAVPALPDRYPAYPGSSASRAALAAIGTLYTELGRAIRGGDAVIPDFARAGHVQRLLARLDPFSDTETVT